MGRAAPEDEITFDLTGIITPAPFDLLFFSCPLGLDFGSVFLGQH